jgi:hypothetical protein
VGFKTSSVVKKFVAALDATISGQNLNYINSMYLENNEEVSSSVNEFFPSIQRKEDTSISIPVDSTELEIIDGRIYNIESLNLTVIQNKRLTPAGNFPYPT